MPDTDWKSKSFDSASDVTKQLITLGTGIVTITITFLNDFTKGAKHLDQAHLCLGVSWGLLAASVVCGLLTLGAFAGGQSKDSAPDIYSSNARVLSALQWFFFGLGLIAAVVAAWYVL